MPPIHDKAAFVKEPLELFAAAPPVDGKTFDQIAQYGKKDIPLEIVSLWKVPGNLLKPKHVREQRRHPDADQDRIDHGQMVRADDPRSLVLLLQTGHLTADPIQIPDPVSSQPDSQENKRSSEDHGQAAQEVLESQEETVPSSHDP